MHCKDTVDRLKQYKAKLPSKSNTPLGHKVGRQLLTSLKFKNSETLGEGGIKLWEWLVSNLN